MKSIIVANWKMNPSVSKEGEQLFGSINKELKKAKKTTMVICPPFIYLPDLFRSFFKSKKTQIKLGAQDCFWEEQGSYTGEISCSMLKKLGCKYVIIGHSERRGFLNETNQMINKKIKAALTIGLQPIICVGEKGEENKNNKTVVVLKSQIENAFKGLSKKQIQDLIIAYEPIWAIGTGKACSSNEAHVTRLILQKIISQKYSRPLAQKIKMLYGGSVNSSNIKEYLKDAGFQGVLVGGASLKAKEFVKIIREASTL